MDTALDYSCRLKETINQAKTDIADFSKQLSQLDLAIQDILHCVELEPIGLERAYSLVNQLKEYRIKRRFVKNNHELLQVLLSTLGDGVDQTDRKLRKKVQEQSECTYTPRILKQVK